MGRLRRNVLATRAGRRGAADLRYGLDSARYYESRLGSRLADGLEYLSYADELSMARSAALLGGTLMVGGAIGIAAYALTKSGLLGRARSVFARSGTVAAKKGEALGRKLGEKTRHSASRSLNGHFGVEPSIEIEARAMDALRDDAVLHGRPIEVGPIDDGIIELWGWVGNNTERERALRVIQEVPGVVTVISRLALRESAADLPRGLADVHSEDTVYELEGLGDYIDASMGAELGDIPSSVMLSETVVIRANAPKARGEKAGLTRRQESQDSGQGFDANPV